MDVLRALRMLGCALFVLTVVTVIILPVGVLPSIVGVVLAAVTAVVFLAVVGLTIIKNHSVRGFVQVVIYGALLLVLAGWAGSQFFANEVLVEVEQGETVVFDDDGYNMKLDKIGLDEHYGPVFEVVLTRPDQVSFHETITQYTPLNIDGIEIHPMECYQDYAIFLIQKDIFRNVIVLGGILFLVGLGLFALPPVRKRGVK